MWSEILKTFDPDKILRESIKEKLNRENESKMEDKQ